MRAIVALGHKPNTKHTPVKTKAIIDSLPVVIHLNDMENLSQLGASSGTIFFSARGVLKTKKNLLQQRA